MISKNNKFKVNRLLLSLQQRASRLVQQLPSTLTLPVHFHDLVTTLSCTSTQSLPMLGMVITRIPECLLRLGLGIMSSHGPFGFTMVLIFRLSLW